MELLQTGLQYALLPDAYVIFICDYDPFGQKKYRYTFDMVCKEDGRILLEDGSHTIFLSTCGENGEEVPEGLVKFLQFVKAGLEDSKADFDDAYVKKLQESVQKIKASREMEERYMLLMQEWIEEEREDAKAEGKAEIILEILGDLGEEIPVELREKIMQETDFAVLKFYRKKASAANSVAEFEKMIAEYPEM